MTMPDEPLTLALRPEIRNLLTIREIQVAEWLGFGKTLWETSVILAMVDRTAEKHRDNIYRKFDVHSRVEFLLHGFVPVPVKREGEPRHIPQLDSSSVDT